MAHDTALKGAIAAVPTPFDGDKVDTDALVRHCRRLLDQNIGITLNGTTGEAASLSTRQKIAIMEAIAAAGLPLARFMAGTGAAALEDAVELTRVAEELGYGGCLVLPPFYFAGVEDAGLLDFFSRVIERARPKRLYLYNFPKNTKIQFSDRFLSTLCGRFPDIVAGLKDSAGDVAATRRLADSFPTLDVFPSAEGILLNDDGAAPFAGVISASINVTGGFFAGGKPSALGEFGPEHGVEIRGALAATNLLPAVKWLVGELSGEPVWRAVLPPLRPLDGTSARDLGARLGAARMACLKAWYSGG